MTKASHKNKKFKASKTSGKQNYDNSKEFEQEIIDNLMENFRFVTFADTKKIQVYIDGVYKKDGEKIIEEECEKLYSEITSHKVEEIKKHIIRRTMKNRNEFDANPDIINLKNCLFDLKRSKIMPHTPAYLSQIQFPAEYNKDAKCPNILAFLKSTLEGKYVKIALTLMSCALTGTNKHQIAGMLFGSGSNGKGVFQNLNIKLFGDENVCAVSPHELETDRFAVADMDGKRLNVCGDMPVRPLKDTSILKKAIGGDPLRAQKKFGQPFKFVNRAIMLFSTNAMPDTPDKSRGFYRRWITIPFLKVFEGNEDTNLLEKLTTKEELSGYLNLLLASYKMQKISGKFPGLDSVENREQAYNKMQDSVKYFLNERTEIQSDSFTTKDDMYEAYKQYCENENIPTETKETFGKKLIGAGIKTVRKSINGHRTWGWKNLKPT